MGRVDEMRATAKRFAERGEVMRTQHESVDVLYVIADRDSEVGGGLLAGALAYRIFIWLLPFALVVVGGIGLVSTEESPSSATRSLGLTGVVASSVASASRGSSRWYALLIGIPILLWASRSLLKALIVAHRIVWGDLRRSAPKPTAVATLEFLAFMIGYFAIRLLARWIGIWSGSTVVRVVAAIVLVTLWWLLIAVRLPHGGSSWLALLPGALVVAIGLEVVADVGTYFFAPRLRGSESTYGALGIAAGLLFGLFIVSRLVVASAVLNAALWHRRSPETHAP